MNAYRKYLQLWLTITSFIGFAIGWAFIARATETDLKTVTTVGNTIVTMSELPPIPEIEALSGETITLNNVQTFTVTQSQPQTMTQPMRTGGS